MEGIWGTILMIYLIGVGVLFFGILFVLIFDDDEEVQPAQFVCWCIFWPFYLMFYTPKIIIEIAKFIFKVFKQAFNDLTKIYKE